MRLGDSGRRLRGAVIALAFVLSLFGARLVQLQGLDAPTYAAEAEAGRLRTVTLPAVRGTITDRNGVALATTVAAVNVTADQTKVVDPAVTASLLAPVLGLDPTVLREKLTGTARFVYVAKSVTPAAWRQVRVLQHPDFDSPGLPGIYSEQTSKRVYPNGSVAANLVGFVGADGKGLGGLEYSLDKTLAGRAGDGDVRAVCRRPPDPERRRHRAGRGRRLRRTAHDRPRHPVRRAEGDRQGGRGLQRAERHRHRLPAVDR